MIIEKGPKPRVIGEIDRPAAPLLVHDEAIYMHGGQQYHVDRLDWQEKKAYVRKVDVDYYTDANLAVDLEVLESFERAPGRGCEVDHGEVAVRDSKVPDGPALRFPAAAWGAFVGGVRRDATG